LARPLADGLYEHVVTNALAADLEGLDPGRKHDTRPLDAADGHLALARHVAAEVARILAEVPEAERVGLVNQVLATLADNGPQAERGDRDEAVAPPGTQLRSISRGKPPKRPATPLASSTLLTRNQAEPSLGHEIASEIASAERVDALVAFVTVAGVRALRSELEAFANRGGKLRLLTTVFTRTTEVEALASLARLPGAEVKVSFDVMNTRLHAKAWLFHRASGLHTAYIGSANLTAPALGSGHEWMVKVCAADLPHVIEKFEGTFESLWKDREFVPFDPASEEDNARLRAALDPERARSGVTVLFDLVPKPFQEEILDRLEAERFVHGRHRNLVVAATGTGKTVIAAFDYRRQAGKAGAPPRLLFLAHRRELLDQARTTFRHVLHEGSFGEMLTDGDEPERWDHVFATVQSAVRRDLIDRFGVEHFRYVVVDECHHAPADSYQKLVPLLRPEILLGLTATPDRMDGKSLLPDFDHHVAAELPLRRALSEEILVPFEYYGVADGTDLTRLKWGRSGYDEAELADLYTGNEARVDLIVGQLAKRVANLRAVHALAFCVSVDHAEFMARALARRGVPALAVHGKSEDEDRADASRRLQAREVNVLCTCDLYNEGVDLPFADTLLLLRPTASAMLFMQQLGRGLRRHQGKASCLVLDFIGRHRTEFRLDTVLSALSGVSKARLKRAVEEGFPFLPSGCVLQLDAVARDEVLRSFEVFSAQARRLVSEVRELAAEHGGRLTLGQFLGATGRDLDEVYTDDGGWTTLRRRAGLSSETDEETEDLSRRLGWLTHVDEPTRLRGWRRLVEPASPKPETQLEVQRLAMLDFQLNHRGILNVAEETARYLTERPEIRSELLELADALEDKVALAKDVYPVADWPLALHRHYKQREILAAVGAVRPGQRGKNLMSGILKLEDQKRELLLVTLDKSGKSFSPTTRYRDYAVSRDEFHWETQSVASVSRPSGRRYIESPANLWSFYLFVRTDPDAAFAFVGPVHHVSHTGDRPIAITWRLAHPLPAALYQPFASLTPG